MGVAPPDAMDSAPLPRRHDPPGHACGLRDDSGCWAARDAPMTAEGRPSGWSCREVARMKSLVAARALHLGPSRPILTG